MKYYSGLDVSLKTTFISIIDDKQNIVMEGEVATDPDHVPESDNQEILALSTRPYGGRLPIV